jgi:hypothetical protein
MTRANGPEDPAEEPQLAIAWWWAPPITADLAEELRRQRLACNEPQWESIERYLRKLAPDPVGSFRRSHGEG